MNRKRAKKVCKRRITRYIEEKMVVKEIGLSKCGKCRCTRYAVVYLPTNNGYGVYCKECGAFVKFLNKDEKLKFGIETEPKETITTSNA